MVGVVRGAMAIGPRHCRTRHGIGAKDSKPTQQNAVRDVVPKYPDQDQGGRDACQDEPLALEIEHADLLGENRFVRVFRWPGAASFFFLAAFGSACWRHHSPRQFWHPRSSGSHLAKAIRNAARAHSTAGSSNA